MVGFISRTEAGSQIASLLKNIDSENTAIIALSRGAVVIAEQIAKSLHSSVYIFAVDDEDLKSTKSFSALSSHPVFSYNTAYPLGEVEDDSLAVDFFTDVSHMNVYQKLNKVVGVHGHISKNLLKRHTIILVSDGLNNALSLKIAVEFLKPVNTNKLILATPTASLDAIDKMHILVDQIFCLQTFQNYVSTNHYYQINQIPDDKTVVEKLKNIVLNWEIKT